MKKLTFYFFILLLISCNEKQTLNDISKDIFKALKNDDYNSFEKYSLISNKKLKFEMDTLLGEPIGPGYEREYRDRLKANFEETRQKIMKKKCIWEQANYKGFSFQGEQEGKYEIYTGKITFECNAEQFVLLLGRFIRKEKGKYYLLSSSPFYIDAAK